MNDAYLPGMFCMKTMVENKLTSFRCHGSRPLIKGSRSEGEARRPCYSRQCVIRDDRGAKSRCDTNIWVHVLKQSTDGLRRYRSSAKDCQQATSQPLRYESTRSNIDLYEDRALETDTVQENHLSRR